MLIHEGRVEECGTHTQLLGSPSGPMYTELYQLYQSKYEKVQRHRQTSIKETQFDDGSEMSLSYENKKDKSLYFSASKFYYIFNEVLDSEYFIKINNISINILFIICREKNRLLHIWKR